MKRSRIKSRLLVLLLGASIVTLPGCAPAAFLAANPMVVAAMVATVPAIATIWSTRSSERKRLEVERLKAETDRINALTASSEKINQQLIAQRELELKLIQEKKTADPDVRRDLEALETQVKQDKEIVEQSVQITASNSAKLANDTGSLEGITNPSSSLTP